MNIIQFFFNTVLEYNFYSFSLHMINFMLGFFISSILSTAPANTGDWGIIGASVIVTLNEIASQLLYKNYLLLKRNIIIIFINDIKIGIIYGLFVDAFKLGS
uniref:Uncharacterized protein ycf20 n=1 Tax=Anotrichium furcellatum TaxID=41999 RepID=A0A4D6WP65_9FLOR|nr:hypothetical protein [Anotrichium furcellatum]